MKERGLFGTELPKETKAEVVEKARKDSESPDKRQSREPSQEKKKFFGGKKNVSNPFPTKKEVKKTQPPVTLGNLGPATDFGGMRHEANKVPQPEIRTGDGTPAKS